MNLINQLEDLVLQMGTAANAMLDSDEYSIRAHGNELWGASNIVETWIEGIREKNEDK